MDLEPSQVSVRAPASAPSPSRLLPAVVVLCGLGLAASLALAYGDAHRASAGFCGAGSDCLRVLASPYARVAGMPLAWWGVLYYAALLAVHLFAYGVQGGRAYSRCLRAAEWAGLLGTLASGVLLYVQFGVLRFFCPLCTASALLAAAIYVLDGRIPRGTARAPQPLRAGMLALGLAVAGCLGATLVILQQRSQVVLRIDGEETTAEDLQREMQIALYGIENQAYQAKRSWVDRKVGERMVSAEARRRGVTPERLIAEQIDAGIEVSDAEIDAWLAKRAPDMTEEEKRRRVRRAIVSEKREERLQALIEDLKKQHAIEVRLEAPQAPSLSIDTTLAHVDGPPAAPVRIVVFSDFQCPFCAKLAATLRRVRERYPADVSVAFLHGPLEGHERAEPAAIAAECAAAQGRFFEYHDRLFADPAHLDDHALVDHARALHLDLSRFGACLAGEDAKKAVREDRAQAQRLGIASMPSLFLNGRHLGGALEYVELARLVEEELRGHWASLGSR